MNETNILQPAIRGGAVEQREYIAREPAVGSVWAFPSGHGVVREVAECSDHGGTMLSCITKHFVLNKTCFKA